MRLLGFKLKRYREWAQLVRREGRPLGWTQRAKLARRLILAGLGLGNHVSRKTWRRRMRICHSCVLFDKSLHRCRPYDGSEFGCGCSTWLVGLMKAPYQDGCWGMPAVGWPAEKD